MLSCAAAIYRLGDKQISTFLASRPGLLGLAALLIGMASGTIIVYHYRQSRRCRSKQFAPTVILNLISVVGLLLLGELAVRALSIQTPEGATFMTIALRPQSWGDTVERNREILRRSGADRALLVYDPLMGWTVGPNRRSADGLSFSSNEGIRSPRPNMAFANQPAIYRIALVGDGRTFCLDVSYEESWGFQLEHALGPKFQVLNFGVSGYGLDQSYLRYYQDVRPWHPDVVLLGFSPPNLYRTLSVYSFVGFPQLRYPFAKPRFVLTGGQLAALNVPPLTPEAIIATNSITDLPFVDYDRGYNPVDWEWSYYHRSYILRLLISLSPRWPVPNQQTSDEAVLSVSTALLRSFIQVAMADGSTPLVVYLPAPIELNAASPHSEKARRILQSAGITPIDLTPTLLKLSALDRFVTDSHYSPRANMAIAQRLREVVLDHVSRAGWPR